MRTLDEEDGASPQKRAELIDRVEQAIDQGSSVVDAVRSISARPGEHRNWDRRSLRAITEEVINDHRASHSPEVLVYMDDGIPDVKVPEDPVHLVLHNLVENAAKYSDPKQKERWVRIHCERSSEDGHLTVHVGDNGLGISEDEQSRIFLRFRRGRAATGDGFGLGLAIVRETARKFGGRILLESEPGRGSTFSFTIPSDQIVEE